MSSMTERHEYILNRLQKEGSVKVSDLGEALSVSAVTIRKDLTFLEERNLLFRSHGNATLRNPYIQDRPVDEKEALHVEEKQRIARHAASLVTEGEAIILGSGTTMAMLARELLAIPNLTVLTSAMNVAQMLLPARDVEIVLLGGVVRKRSASVVGPYAEEMIQNFSCSKLFLGVDGLTLSHGLTTSHLMEAHLNREMMAAAEQTLILTDSSKFGRKGFGRICGMEEADHLITDTGLGARWEKEIEDIGVLLTQV